MYNLNFDTFKSDLFNATKDIVRTYKQKVGGHSICAFALYSDESASSISASLNMIDHLKKLSVENPKLQRLYKWSPAEWQYEGLSGKVMDRLSKQLFDISMGADDSDEVEEVDAQFEEFRTRLFDLCVAVLQSLKQEGLFDKMHSDFILMFDVSDYSDDKAKVSWVRQLNDEKIAKEFEDWLSEE